jgi:TPP-dependent pyruvate/acetoin dehydrogenase alpha subunit
MRIGIYVLINLLMEIPGRIRVRYNVKVMEDNYKLYHCMLLIRHFEERLLAEFSTGKLVGTTHTYIGQEADAAGIFSVTEPEDIVFSNHRCHGHFLAYGGEPYRLVAELMGKSTGLVGGRGGSQHIHWRNFYSNGIQGGIVPVATGMALAEKIQATGKITLVFIGDGTLGEGVLYESMNIASLWKLPILFVLENNRFAQTTPVEKGVAGSIPGRFAAFGIPVWERDTTDVLEIQSAAKESLASVRSGNGPAGLILHTYRFSAHSKGDDPRSVEELAAIRQFDPLTLHGSRLSNDDRQAAVANVTRVIHDAFERADGDPFPTLSVNTRSINIELQMANTRRSSEEV